MLEVHMSGPPEIAVPLLSAQHFHHKLQEIVDEAKTNEKLRRVLLVWAESLTRTNCDWFEYDVGREVLTQLQTQIIPAKPAKTELNRTLTEIFAHIDNPRELSMDPPIAITNIITAFSHAMFDYLFRIEVTAMFNKEIEERLLAWAKTTEHGSWAARWVAEYLHLHITKKDV